ncbi:MAG: DUF1566 domain-containing protein, partial [Spirochaetaceae bacterium]|nr:DUF1566 domain-containing protein [Spirochaetaceae bacterium]
MKTKKNKCAKTLGVLGGMLVMVLAFGLVLVGCATDGGKAPVVNGGETPVAEAVTGTDGGGTTYTSDGETIYAVGSTGPAGGLVFYYSAEGFVVDGLTGTFHYLEASPANVDLGGRTELSWQGRNGTACNTTATGIGGGYSNTNELQTHRAESHGHDNPAAHACWVYSAGGKDDWWLPSKDELNALYIEYAKLTDKTGWSNYYWSSSEYDADT